MATRIVDWVADRRGGLGGYPELHDDLHRVADQPRWSMVYHIHHPMRLGGYPDCGVGGCPDCGVGDYPRSGLCS